MNNLLYQLKIAIRNLRRGGMYSSINIGGLAIGLAACILITLWVWDELSYDRSHKNGNRIYRVLSIFKGNADYWSNSPAPLAAFVQPDIPQIEKYCRTGRYRVAYLDYNNTKFFNVGSSVLAVDTFFFDMFNYPLVEGNTGNPLPDDLSIIVSKTQARTLFGDENPIGKALKADNDLTFHVTGIMADMPGNSSIQADFLVRFDVLQRTFRGNGNWKQIEEDWGSYNYETYLQLAVGSNPVEIADKMAKKRDDENLTYRLQPLHEMHLYALDGHPTGMKNVYIFSIIAVLILTIACINQVNLVTARSSKRSREMAVRKITGAKKPNLLGLLMNETLVMLLVSLVVATAFIYLLLPFYNEIAGKQMQFHLFSLPVALIYLSVAIITLLLAGLYLAFSLASFQPIDAFRAGSRSGGKVTLRKILVVLQFTISICLIIATIVAGMQLQHMQNKNKLYDDANIFMVYMPHVERYEAAKARLLSEPAIMDVSGSCFNKMMNESGSRGDIWKNVDNQWPIFHQGIVDTGFFALMDIPLLEGRNIVYSKGMDAFSQGIIVNETAARLIGGGESVVGKHVDKENAEIVGVVQDFNFQTLHHEIKPMIIVCFPQMIPFVYVKAAPGKTKQAIAAVETIWKEYNPEYSFSYSFLSEDFEKLYKSDIRTGKLFSIFAIIAIFISCLGLFGLVTYTAETKTKEIGIRKVLGASIAGIVELLSKEFIILVGIAMLIAFPLAYYWLNRMLQDYAYRIDISWWMFAVAALITVALTLFTIGWQAIKAATANPVKSLKTE